MSTEDSVEPRTQRTVTDSSGIKDTVEARIYIGEFEELLREEGVEEQKIARVIERALAKAGK